MTWREGYGKIAWEFRENTVLTEDLSLIPNMQVKWLTTIYSCSFQNPMPLASTGTHMHLPIHKHIIFKKKYLNGKLLT